MGNKLRFKLPDALVIMSAILLIMTLLTWIVPPGSFDRTEVNGRIVVQPGTYSSDDFSGQGLFDLLLSPVKGFMSAAQIIAFVLIVGGAFKIIQKTGAFQTGLENMVRFAEANPTKKKYIIPLLTLFFSLAGATFGMSEEVLVFVLITIPMARSLGYDTLVGISVPFLGAGAGFAGAFSNPFTIGIAQAIADVPLFSGIYYRTLVWFFMTLTTILFLMRYARKIEKSPHENMMISKRSPVSHPESPFTFRQKWVLAVLFSGIVMLVIGATQLNWYINEISGLFLAMGLISAMICKISPNDTAMEFIEGAKDMLTAAMVIAFSRGILILAEDGKIIDTMLFYTSDLINDLPRVVAVQGMFFFQTLLNFFVPSGSGQAALTMPIMAPLSDLVGITRQTAVLSFQLGDGLSNMIIPTSGVTMGVLSIAKVPYQKWLKFALPLILLLTIVGIIALIPPTVLFYWGPI